MSSLLLLTRAAPLTPALWRSQALVDELCLAVSVRGSDAVLCACQRFCDFTGGTGLRKEREALCKSRGEKYTSLCGLLVQCGAVAALVGALDAFFADAVLAQWVTHCIRNLQPTTADKERAASTIRQWMDLGALPLLLKTLRLHQLVEPCVISCCGAITNLSCGGDEVASALVELRAVPLLVETSGMHMGSARALDMAWGALGNIAACKEKQPAEEVYRSGLMRLLPQALKAHGSVALVVETVAYTLLFLTYLGEGVCTECCTAPSTGGPSLLHGLIDALSAHAQDTRTLEMVVEVLRNLAYSWEGLVGPQAGAKHRRYLMVESPGCLPGLVKTLAWASAGGVGGSGTSGVDPAADAEEAPQWGWGGAGSGSSSTSGGGGGGTGGSGGDDVASGGGVDADSVEAPDEGDMTRLIHVVNETLSLLKYTAQGLYLGKAPSTIASPMELCNQLRAGLADPSYTVRVCKVIARKSAGNAAARKAYLGSGVLAHLFPLLERPSVMGEEAHLAMCILKAATALVPAGPKEVWEVLQRQGCQEALLSCLAPNPPAAPYLAARQQWAAALVALLLAPPGAPPQLPPALVPALHGALASLESHPDPNKAGFVALALERMLATSEASREAAAACGALHTLEGLAKKGAPLPLSLIAQKACAAGSTPADQ